MEDQKVIAAIKPTDFSDGDIKALTDFFSILLKIDKRIETKKYENNKKAQKPQGIN